MSLIDTDSIETLYNNDDPCLRYVRSTWDSYKSDKDPSFNMTRKDQGILAIKNNFPNHNGAKYFKPLGDFKDFDDVENLTQEKVYENWKNKFEEIRESTPGKTSSFERVVLENAMRLQKQILGHNKYSIRELRRGLSFMLWRAAEGVVKEVEVLCKLQELYNNENRKLIAAPGWYETYDIDCILVDDEGNHRTYISIKNMYALSESSMDVFRNKKGKKKPMLYCGFKPNESKLTFLYPTEFPVDKVRRHFKNKNCKVSPKGSEICQC